MRDFNANHNKKSLNEIEIIAHWKLFGIHDAMILIKGNKPKSNLTNFMKYCRSFVDKEYETPCVEGEKDIPDFLKFPHKKIRIMEFWCDPLIPFKVELEELKKSNPFLISFIRLKNFNGDKLHEIGEMFDQENFSNDVVGLFQGYGLYDLIAIIKCKNYKDVQMKLNTLRAMKLNNTSNINTSLFLDTASIITLSEQNNEFLMFSALLKIKPAQDKPEYWNEIKSIIEKTIIKNGIKKFKCKLVISHRQGFFDIIITVRGHYQNYMTFVELLETFPFIEDVATILRFDYFEV